MIDIEVGQVFEITEWDASRDIVKVTAMKIAYHYGTKVPWNEDHMHDVSMTYSDGVTHVVTLEQFRDTLKARKVNSDRWGPKATAARIQAPGANDYGRARVMVVIDGDEHEAFSYYVDELRFTPEEFVGKTLRECMARFTERDIAYLRS